MAAKFENPDILDCGLCNKLLNVPKTLPCLHMFCEECLCQFISGELQEGSTAESRNIHCPVCETSFPFSANVDIFTFVKQFPTNQGIDIIIKRENLTLNGAVCGPCQRRKILRKTKLWCGKCEEGLCNKCCNLHFINPGFLLHKIIDVSETEAENFPTNADTICMIHKDMLLDHFCNDHNQPYCRTCGRTQHRWCNNMTTLEDAARKCKAKNETFHLIQNLDEAFDTLSNDIGQRENFLQQIETDRDGVKDNIASFRTEINNFLDYLETEMHKEFKALHCKRCKPIELQTDLLKNTRKIISNCKRLLEVHLERSSDINTFLEKERVESKLREQEEIMTELSSEPAYKFQYRVSFAKELENLKLSLQSLGVVKCVKITPTQLSIGGHTSVPRDTPHMMGDDQLQELMTFTTNKLEAMHVHGIELLPDGRTLFTNNKNQYLYLFDNKGNLQKEILLPGKPRDVTIFKQNKAAVTYDAGHFYRPDGVCIVNIHKMNISKENIIHGREYSVHGITSRREQLIIACVDKIVILHRKGKVIREIQIPPPFSFVAYITSISDTVFCYTNQADRSVICIDINGTIIFKYTHWNLKLPIGIASDNEGNIYVAGHYSDNVHQISAGGKLKKILLCENDVIAKPYAIGFDRRNNKLAITHAMSKVSVYQVRI